MEKRIFIAKKYMDMPQLDAAILRELVEQTGAPDTYATSEQQKQVTIRKIENAYKFMGAFDFEGAWERSQTAQWENNAKAGAA